MTKSCRSGSGPAFDPHFAPAILRVLAETLMTDTTPKATTPQDWAKLAGKELKDRPLHSLT